MMCLLSACSAPMDTNLLSNIHKLFSERIDIFSSVEFNKVGAGLQGCVVFSVTDTHTQPFVVPGLRDNWNYQNQFEDVPGVCSPAHLRPFRAAADPG